MPRCALGPVRTLRMRLFFFCKSRCAAVKQKLLHLHLTPPTPHTLDILYCTLPYLGHTLEGNRVKKGLSALMLGWRTNIVFCLSFTWFCSRDGACRAYNYHTKNNNEKKYFKKVSDVEISQVSGSWVNREAETPGAPIPFRWTYFSTVLFNCVS